MHDDFGLRYINCGDWVESCTAVAEESGRPFEIITWTHAGQDMSQAEQLRDRGRRRATSRMKILVATDAWHPQVNGVVRTLGHMSRAKRVALGAEIEFLTPPISGPLPMPSYPEMRLALTGPGDVERRLDRIKPDAIHIATEGPIGHAVRRVCLRRGHRRSPPAFTPAFPIIIAERLPVPRALDLRVDLGLAAPVSCAGAAVLAATPTLGART